MPTSSHESHRELYALTHPQKRIMRNEQIHPGTPIHNIGGSIHIHGPVDFGLLREAITRFVNRHEAFWLRFTEEQGEYLQYVHREDAIAIPLHDFSGSEHPFDAFRAWEQQKAETPFPLNEAVLFDFAMFCICPERSGYFVRLHHAIADGWSIQLMTSQIVELYEEVERGMEPSAEAYPSYLSFLQLESQYLQSRRCAKNRQYWMDQFQQLPDSFLSSGSNRTNGKKRTFVFDTTASNRIQAYAESRGISLNTFFVSVMLLYLYKTTHGDDLIIGTPVLNRSGREERRIFGMFTSTMPFRMKIGSSEKVHVFVQQVHERLVSGFFHQRYPYDRLVQDLALRKKGYSQLFQASVNTYHTKLRTSLKGWRIENEEFYNGHQFEALQWIIKEWSATENVQLDILYRADDYTDLQIEQMYRWISRLSEQLLEATADTTIQSLTLLDAREEQLLLHDWNDTEAPYPQDRTMVEMFEEQVARSPHSTALVYKETTCSYQELNEQANRIAHGLRARGAGPETVVGLMCERSLEMMVGLMGILKAGSAYLPIDPSWPEERLTYMIQDSGMKLLLTTSWQRNGRSLLDAFSGEVLEMDSSVWEACKTINPEPVLHPEHLAYILYTSGSTGKPKGVMVEHRAVVNRIHWMQQQYPLQETDVLLQKTPITFDVSVWELFWWSWYGAKLCILEPGAEKEPEKLTQTIARQQVSVLHFVPSMLRVFIQWLQHQPDGRDRLHSVRQLFTSGEALKGSDVQEVHHWLGPRTSLTNLYGPTEATIDVSYFDCTAPGLEQVPIGKPIYNTQLYVLDPQQRPVPVGVAGELYIGGVGLARGYVNQADLTTERFISHPFHSGERLYRTGDLAAWMPDGNLAYLGRTDHQVKIRGYRIELGEIEKTVLQHPHVHEVIVVDRVQANGQTVLCCYFVASFELAWTEMRTFLSGKLPAYMVPAHFVQLDALPLTPSGKVDRKSLPEPAVSTQTGPDDERELDEVEQLLLQWMEEVLQVKGISSQAHFYQLGGDSIKAIQLSAKLHEAGYMISVQDILAHPVLEDMARYVRVTEANATSDEDHEERPVRFTPIMTWFFNQALPNPHYFHQSILLDLKQRWKREELEQILTALIEHHGVLRLRLDVQGHSLVYETSPARSTASLTVIDLGEMTADEQRQQVDEQGRKVKEQIHLERGPLFQGCLFDRGAEGQSLLLVAHHLIIDGVSWRIILEDLCTMFEQIQGQKPIQLPFKTASYQTYAEHLHAYGEQGLHEEQAYWEQAAAAAASASLPIDRDRAPADIQSPGTLLRTWCSEVTIPLLHEAQQAYGTQVNELLMMALVLSLQAASDDRTVVLELEGHGREDVLPLNISRTVGWFTSLFPVCFEVPAGGLPEQIKSLKEQIRGIPNKGIGYGLLRDNVSAIGEQAETRLVRLNYLGQLDREWETDWFSFSTEATGPDSDPLNPITARLEINAWIVSEQLHVAFHFNRHEMKEEQVREMAARYEHQLLELITHCCGREEVMYTPSDFSAATLSQDELDDLFE
ncbi:amino acid adenylation domain-containing protein [Marinicrinis sediminis]|uniref:Amino acid adenylation domain-containing protein n=1 Tax=Marinicrinis sediminis TaxID=1652465 RepID=A0ABW5RA58_9BACL